MSTMTGLDAISQSLGAMTPVASLPRPSQSTELAEVKESPEIEDDYQEARSNLKELIGQMMEQVPDLISITQQAQSDKMYSSAATFIKTVADLNISLSKLSKEIKQAPKREKQTDSQAPIQQVTQNNNVFVGSTEDFLAMMEDRKKAEKEKENTIDGDFSEVDS